MDLLEDLLRLGAPWWLVLPAFVLFLTVALVVALRMARSASGEPQTRTSANGGVGSPQQKIEINIRTGEGIGIANAASEGRSTDDPFDRIQKHSQPQGATQKSTLRIELEMMKSEGDEVYVYDLPPERQ